MADAPVSLNAQLAEARTLLEEHSFILERNVAKGMLGQREAEFRKTRLRGVIRTLEWLRDNEAAVRAAVGPRP